MTPLLLFLSASLPAQVVPFGFDTREGAAFHVGLGAFPDGRVQLADRGLRGEVAVLRSFAVRADGEWRNGFESVGRRWNDVRLRLSDGDADTMTSTFATNALSTPVLVHSGSVSWPTMKGLGSALPWDPGLAFPFANAYVYAGKKDLLLDFEFRGGTVTSGTGFPPYLLDAGDPGDWDNRAVQGTPFGSTACRDSKYVFGPTGLTAQAASYRQKTRNPNTSNRVFLRTQTRWTAPLAPVVYAIGAVGYPAGIPIGACNRLYTDPLLLSTLLADGSGSARSEASFPYSPALEGFPVWIQAGWIESQRGTLELTNASRIPVPRQAPDEAVRAFVTANSPTAPTGNPPVRGLVAQIIAQYGR